MSATTPTRDGITLRQITAGATIGIVFGMLMGNTIFGLAIGVAAGIVMFARDTHSADNHDRDD